VAFSRFVEKDMKNSYSVYVHTAPNGKRYVGITKQDPLKRWKNGLGYENNPHFYSAIQKYGWDNILHEVLYQGLSQEQAGEIEKTLIAEYGTCDPKCGYNHSLGGDYGVKHTDTTKRKISLAKSEFYSHEENREAVSRRMRGRVVSEETRRKLSLSRLGKPNPLSSETTSKISDALKRRIRESPFGETTAERCRARGEKQAIRVLQFDKSGVCVGVYDSFHAAERATGIRNGNISRCCSGGTKTAGGYMWRKST
jgi:group I intron endonuclease